MIRTVRAGNRINQVPKSSPGGDAAKPLNKGDATHEIITMPSRRHKFLNFYILAVFVSGVSIGFTLFHSTITTMGGGGVQNKEKSSANATKVDFDNKKSSSTNSMKVDFERFCSINMTHSVPNNTFVTIFVMVRDRLSCLQASLESYHDTISSPYEIVILDHNSTYPPTVQYLHELQTKQNNNISIVALTQKTWKLALIQADDIIRNYLNENPHVGYYVFTDPDIAFLRTSPDVLLFYAGLLRSCPSIRTVGPGLQISDIPPHFTKTVNGGKSVYEQHSQFWNSVPNMATWNGLGYHVVNKLIDTTFQMRRRGDGFVRLQGPSLRAYAPYAAVHVDWYDDSENLPEDKVYYKKRQSGKVNNW